MKAGIKMLPFVSRREEKQAGAGGRRRAGGRKRIEESCPEPPLIQFLFKETMEMHLDEQRDE